MTWALRFAACAFIALLVLAAGVAGLFYGAGALLAWPAGEPARADAVVVLGGDGGERYSRAAELLDGAWASRLLLIHADPEMVTKAVARFSRDSVWVENAPRNSWQEAVAVKARMQVNGWRHVLVVSDPPHMLRLRFTWSSVLRGSDLSYSLIATEPAWWSAWHWRDNQQSLEYVVSEWLKLAYYVLRYQFGLLGGMEPLDKERLIRLDLE
ncbi:MAG: YdcF family protein [Hydrogenophilales bacterium]|nr:YdcF family protein [Hydrogenophilales bacterium]